MSHLTAAQLQELRESLIEKRAKLLDYKTSVDAADPANDPNRVDSNESGDEALETYGMLESQALENESGTMLAEIDAALARMDAGTYGEDVETGDPIPFARLKMFPAARNNVSE